MSCGAKRSGRKWRYCIVWRSFPRQSHCHQLSQLQTTLRPNLQPNSWKCSCCSFFVCQNCLCMHDTRQRRLIALKCSSLRLKNNWNAQEPSTFLYHLCPRTNKQHCLWRHRQTTQLFRQLILSQKIAKICCARPLSIAPVPLSRSMHFCPFQNQRLHFNCRRNISESTHQLFVLWKYNTIQHKIDTLTNATDAINWHIMRTLVKYCSLI